MSFNIFVLSFNQLLLFSVHLDLDARILFFFFLLNPGFIFFNILSGLHRWFDFTSKPDIVCPVCNM